MARRTAAENAEALFELYEQKMYRIAYAILHDEGQAEDAVIAAFEKILKSDGVPRRPQGKAAPSATGPAPACRPTRRCSYTRTASR